MFCTYSSGSYTLGLACTVTVDLKRSPEYCIYFLAASCTVATYIHSIIGWIYLFSCAIMYNIAHIKSKVSILVDTTESSNELI